MSSQPKIMQSHLERLAYVYIRQSSLRQVEENLESQDLQYQLVNRACGFGWPEAQVQVVDDDLGKSGIAATQREGFQNLVAAVGLGQVGIILVTDVSRLARNCSDWYRLLDLASLCGTLISDASGVFDPRIYDDRLLLGLKGAFSEAQWYNMRTQLCAAQMNKARRGDLHLRLPVGLERLEDGQVGLTPNLQVQELLSLVFEQFERLGSAQKVLRYLRDEHLLLPHRSGSRIEWVRPAYQLIYAMLKQPAYAGVYAYGKHHRVHLPGDQSKVVTHTLPQAEWPVLIQQAHPGYLTWDQFQANQLRLAENAQGIQWKRGAPRSGSALLQGLVRCARCGRSMHVHYTHASAYICDRDTREFAAPRCQTFNLATIDRAITQLVLEAVQPARLEAALAAIQQVEAQYQALTRQWGLRLEQARYEVELAFRRYERVDPDNRLVAAELERLWEEKLLAQRQVDQQWQDFQSQRLQPLGPTDQAAIRQLAQDLPTLWFSPSTSQEDRKRLLRCLIREVSLDNFSKPGSSLLRIAWHSGLVTSHEVPRPGHGTPPATSIANRLRQLATQLPDDQIADRLNSESYPTATGLPWTLERVRAVRRKHHVVSLCPSLLPSGSDLPRGDGLLPVRLAAARLHVERCVISDWFHAGLIQGCQRRSGASIWVRLNDDDLCRLDGSASQLPEMLPLETASHILGLNSDQFRATMQTEKLLPYRIRTGKQFKWFVLPINPTTCAQ
ncbi:MAG TPA: recombinase family protein [Anaerolineales bacterium]|nr:recombinase family protein [Anaerolineales bacterium]